MPDFTCALYLGLWHASGELRPWAQLTTGRPAAVRSVRGSATVAQRVAALQGCEAATLAPSTLHGAWDLGGLFAPRRDALHVDAEVYPVLRVAAMRARSRGIAVHEVAHHDPGALKRCVRADARRPVLLIDGLCPACGGPAPLAPLLAVLRRRGGMLVVDDTQAAGILGAPGAGEWGRGGGGSLRYHGLEGASDVLLLTSFAKALGAPVAAIAGSAATIERFERGADSRVHFSPVSAAAVHALDRALTVNDAHGEALRRTLARAVRRLRLGLRKLAIRADGGSFPVQALAPLARRDALALHRHLLSRGIRAIPQAWGGGAEGRAVFVITARTSDADIDAALAAVAGAPQLHLLRGGPARPRVGPGGRARPRVGPGGRARPRAVA